MGVAELRIDLPPRELPDGKKEDREAWIQCSNSVSLEMVGNAFAQKGLKI